MKSILLTLLIVLGSAQAVWSDAWQMVYATVENKDFDGFVSAIGSIDLGFGDSKSDVNYRFALGRMLVGLPPKFLQVCLDKGFDPNVVFTVDYRSETSWRSLYFHGTFVYQVLLSNRKELLSLVKPSDEAQRIWNVDADFEKGTLTRLNSETLKMAALRMGDSDSLAFAATLKVPADPKPDDSLLEGTINDDGVRARAGAGVTFPVVAKWDQGTSVTVLEAGPPRFVNREPWLDRWFRVSVQGQPTGWVWGRYLDLSFPHGQELDGDFLVDFMLLKQNLLDDVWNRSRTAERWRYASLYEWAVALQDGAFVKFLVGKKLPEFISLGEEGESLTQRLVRKGDIEGLGFWVANGGQLDYDLKTSYGPQAYTALLDLPRLSLYQVFKNGNYPFEALRESRGHNGGGDSWDGMSNTAARLIDDAPVAILLELIPTWKNLNQLFVSWTYSYPGYSRVFVKTLMDLAVDRGDPRLVDALRKQRALSRETILAKGIPDSTKIPPSEVNDSGVRLRGSPGTDGKILRTLSKGESVFQIDERPMEDRSDPQGRWVYVLTNKKEWGWVWGPYLAKPNSQ